MGLAFLNRFSFSNLSFLGLSIIVNTSAPIPAVKCMAPLPAKS